MKYKQRTELIPNENFLEQFLRERNIADLNLFLHPGCEQQYDCLL